MIIQRSWFAAFAVAGALAMGACSPSTDSSTGSSGGKYPAPPSSMTFCGGIAGIQCPAGQVCVDDPRDSCNPNQGGADCGGICVKDNDKCKASTRKYVSTDPDECALIRYTCEAGYVAFSDDCGCGCEPAP